MLGLLIMFILLGIGFAAGYAARGFISRKRRAEYFAYEPYLAPSRRHAPPNTRPETENEAPPLKRPSRLQEPRKAVHHVHIGSDKTGRGILRIIPEQNASPAAEPFSPPNLSAFVRPPAMDRTLEDLIRRLGANERRRK